MAESLQRHSQILENLCMVRPARRAHPHGTDAGTPGQRGREPHRAGAAGGLHAFDPPAHGRVGLAEDIGHQRVDELHVALGAEVGLGILLIDQLLLGRLDRGEHRRVALPGAIDAYPEVDLVGARIGTIELDQGEERVGRLLGKCLEHGAPFGFASARVQGRIGEWCGFSASVRRAATSASWRTSYSPR